MIRHSSGSRAPTGWMCRSSGASRWNHWRFRSAIAIRRSLWWRERSGGGEG